MARSCSPSVAGSCNALDHLDLTQTQQVPPGSKPWCVIVPPVRHDQQMVWDVRGIGLCVFSKTINPGLPVIDRTGLIGAFDIRLEFSMDPPVTDPGAATDPPGSSLIAALRKQLGLRLVRGRGPREFLVIDRLEKPSEN